MVDAEIVKIRKQYGMEGRGPAIEFARFETSSLKVQIRFIHLWFIAIKKLKSFDYHQLQIEFAPLSGSLEAIQRPLIKDMEDWMKCFMDLSIAVYGQDARKSLKEMFPAKPQTQKEIIEEMNIRSQERWESTFMARS